MLHSSTAVSFDNRREWLLSYEHLMEGTGRPLLGHLLLLSLRSVIQYEPFRWTLDRDGRWTEMDVLIQKLYTVNSVFMSSHATQKVS
jgi:hypothetical protein